MARPTTIGSRISSTALNTNSFICLFAQTNRTDTESLRVIPIDYNFELARLVLNVFENARVTDSFLRFRDDGASVVSITVADGVTGQADSGRLEVHVVAGSKCCYNVDTLTDGGGGGVLSIIIVSHLFQNRGYSKKGRRRYSFRTFGCSVNSFAGNATNFLHLSGNDATDTTEEVVRIPVDYPFVVFRTRVNVPTNNKNGNTVVALRDDGVSRGAITIGAGVTGEADSGLISEMVLKDSDCNCMVDTSASSSGSIAVTPFVAHVKTILPDKDLNWSWQSFYAFEPSTTSNAANFLGFHFEGNRTTTEALRQISITYEYDVKQVHVNVSTNSKSGNTILGIRDDGVDISPFTIAAGVTGVSSSGSLIEVVAAGSLINARSDTSASASGTLVALIVVHGRAR